MNSNFFKIKIINILFFIICCTLFFLFSLGTFLNNNEINYYENRKAYQIPKLKINDIFNRKYQNDFELFFSDQIPLSLIMKKTYNLRNIFTIIQEKLFFKNKYENRYIKLGSVFKFGKDNLVYPTIDLAKYEKSLKKKTNSINHLIYTNKADIYVYYIERDMDINFVNNKKSGVFEFLKDNINSNNVYRFSVDNFSFYKERFFKSDHHWNNKGAYSAYKDLVKILTKDHPLKYQKEICLNNKFSGSSARMLGADYFYKEDFCFYTFNFPKYDIYINHEKAEYGNYDYYLKHHNREVTYGGFYGGDDGEIIFDNHSSNKKNILIFGESYDNALLKLLASHFNKTFAIDLRYYEKFYHQKFEFGNYVQKNNIDKVLFIGNIYNFIDEDLILEK